ncbi:MAG: endolytic transglycosylase MltG [Elusimicrobiota bacterium]
MNKNVVIALAVLGILGALFFFYNHYMITMNTETVVINIPDGSTADEISSVLKYGGVVRDSGIFYDLIKLRRADRKLQNGTYYIAPRQTLNGLLKKIVKGDTYRIKITIPEGMTCYHIARKLQEKGVVAYKDFVEEVMRSQAEGYLFPETYFFDIHKSSPALVVKTMTEQFEKMYGPKLQAREKVVGLTRTQVVILASLIEKEARTEIDRGMVSAVFQNRLKKRMYLESCATVQYAIALLFDPSGPWKQRLGIQDTKINSPYNTYKKIGLPPGPICNPGISAIKAALYPAESSAMYFVADSSGTHVYSRDFKEHLKNKREQKRIKRSIEAR